MLIKTKNLIVQNALQLITDTVMGNGGFIHPALTINHLDELLWISCPAEPGNNPLLVIPDELFIPITQLEWSGNEGIISYSGDSSSLSASQLSLLDAMVELYNATGKIRNVAESMPAQLLPSDPELMTWLMSTRPNFSIPETSQVRQFIETRLHYKNADKGQEDAIGFLMPLIDLLNHHPYGPKYERTDSGAWKIALTKPNPKSDECFVRYNKADSLSQAIWHSYYEPNTRHIASLDCLLVHSDIGEIRIKGTNASRRNINAPSLLPGESVLTLQDLVLEKEQLAALRTLLGLAARSKLRGLIQSEAEIVADELIQLLIDANIQKYSELQSLCYGDAEHYPLRPLFGQVAKHQLALLQDLRAE